MNLPTYSLRPPIIKNNQNSRPEYTSQAAQKEEDDFSVYLRKLFDSDSERETGPLCVSKNHRRPLLSKYGRWTEMKLNGRNVQIDREGSILLLTNNYESFTPSTTLSKGKTLNCIDMTLGTLFREEFVIHVEGISDRWTILLQRKQSRN